jgi:hypothetical protein
MRTEERLREVQIAIEDLERRHADAFFRQEAKDLEEQIFKLKNEERRLQCAR